LKARDVALGYASDGPPIVPLTGQIVADAPGLLEVYQTHLEFTNSSAAVALIADAAGVSIGGGSTTHLSPPKIVGATDSYEFLSTLGSMNAATEHEVSVGFLFRRSVVELVFRGGRDVGLSLVTQYIAMAAQVFVKMCK
jgi:hypothetical protein